MRFRNLCLVSLLMMAHLCAHGISQSPYAYITNNYSSDISVIDTGTLKEVDRIAVGSAVYTVAIHPTGSPLYVTTIGGMPSEGKVLAIDTRTGATLMTVPLGTLASKKGGMAITPSGSKLYVSTYDPSSMGSGEFVKVIDTSSGALTTITSMEGPAGIAVNPTGTKAYVAGEKELVAIDVATDTVDARVKLKSSSLRVGIAMNPAGTELYVTDGAAGRLHIFDLNLNRVDISLKASGASCVDVHPNGTRAYVAYTDGIAVVDLTQRKTIAWAVKKGCGGQGIAVEPGGKRVLMVANRLDSVYVMDTKGNKYVGKPIKVGKRPLGFGRFVGPAPVPNNPPTCTPNATFMLNVGEAFSATVVGDDLDGDDLRFNYKSTIPSGDVATPATEMIYASPVTATMSWTPTIDQVGQWQADFLFYDAESNARCTFTFVVVDLPPGCSAHSDVLSTHVGDTLQHTFTGTDPDPGDVLTVSAVGLPTGATLTPASGPAPLDTTLSWQPTIADVGQHEVTLTYTDLAGMQTTCTFTIVVLNRPPTFTIAEELIEASIGESLTVALTGLDGDPGDNLTVTHGTLPLGATLAPLSGASPLDLVFAWTPSIADVGTHDISVTFTDVPGDSATCVFQVEVVNSPPECALEFNPFSVVFGAAGELIVTVGDTFVATSTAVDGDPGDSLSMSALNVPTGATLTTVNPLPAPSPQAAIFTWAPVAADAQPDPYEVEITWTDSFGATSTCNLLLVVNQPPIALAGGNTVSMQCAGAGGTLVSFDASSSFDPDGDSLEYHWDVSDFAVVLDDPSSPTPSGLFFCESTMVTLTVSDGRGGLDFYDIEVLIVDTIPPEVMCTTDTAALWPPNHTMRSVTLVVKVTDICGLPDSGLIIPSLVTVRSNEADDENGDGTSTGDVHGQDGFTMPVDVSNAFVYDPLAGMTGAWVATIDLRAERNGGGNGRAYTIDVSAIDTSGNLTMTSCVVVVPHDRSGKGKK